MDYKNISTCLKMDNIPGDIMEFTGERFLPECLGEIAIEHYHRYFFATAFIAGKEVLDIASGEGYGTHILSRFAAHVTGVDVSRNAVSEALAKYSAPNLNFLQGNASSIPLTDASVDVVVSFETLEHLLEQKTMLSEIKRVLRTGGLLIMSTPNTGHFKDGDTDFHLKELDKNEFLALLNEQFANIALHGQKIVFGSLIAGGAEDAVLMRQETSPASADEMLFMDEAMYFIALASDGMLPSSAPSVLERSLEDSGLCIDLRGKINELHSAASELKDECAEQEKKLKLAELQAQKAEKALACLLASNSWRITAPLRWLARKFRSNSQV